MHMTGTVLIMLWPQCIGVHGTLECTGLRVTSHLQEHIFGLLLLGKCYPLPLCSSLMVFATFCYCMSLALAG